MMIFDLKINIWVNGTDMEQNNKPKIIFVYLNQYDHEGFARQLTRLSLPTENTFIQSAYVPENAIRVLSDSVLKYLDTQKKQTEYSGLNVKYFIMLVTITGSLENTIQIIRETLSNINIDSIFIAKSKTNNVYDIGKISSDGQSIDMFEIKSDDLYGHLIS